MRHATLSSLTAVALVAGCAGPPLVAIEAPGFTLEDSDKAAMTLAEARRHLMKMRATYRQAMAEQLNVTQYSSSSLVVLGAAIMGLAAGKAHSDAIVGASLIGGTSYAIGSLTLDRRRILAFDAGIKALDCANNAVIPLDLDATASKDLREASNRLAQARAKAAGQVAAVTSLLDQLVAAAGIEPGPLAAARKSVGAMNAALADAEKSRKAADKLASDSREIGQRLQNTVNEIAAKVDGVIAQTVPDISAVQQVVAGLGGFASAFAPGAGVDKTLNDAQTKYDKAQKAVSTPTANAATPDVIELKRKLGKALESMDNAGTELTNAVTAVNAGIANVDGAAVAAALKACNVADVVLPLSIEPATLALEAPTASAKGFAISGGTKPYTVRLLDGAVDGLNISFGGGFSDSAQISAAASVPADTYRVLVSDASGTAASRQLLVTVTAKGSATAAGAGGATNPTTSSDDALDKLVKSLNGLIPQKMQGDTEVSVVANSATVDTAAKRVDVTLGCKPAKPTKKLKASEVLDKLVAAAGQPQAVGDKNPLRIKPTNPDCIEG